MVFTKHGAINSPAMQQRSRPVLNKGRLFVFGDSISTIRRPNTDANSANGRYVASTGWNLWDWFRFSFDPALDMGLTTNYAQEGAYAVRDRLDSPAWARILPVPSFNSQITQMIADNPIGTINPNCDVAGVFFGTNDGITNASLSGDGGAIPTWAAVRAAIVAGINRLITHGFERFSVVICEAGYSKQNSGYTNGADLIADLEAIPAGNRKIRLSWVLLDWAMLEQQNPRLDAYHPNDVAHRRMGQILSSVWHAGDWTDLTSSFRLSAFTNSFYPNRTSVIGFSNFNADATFGSTCRVEFADINNSIEAKQNRRLTFRSYNGIDICGAWEANTPTAPAGGGKNDPVMRLRGNFWEHGALLRLDHVPSVPITQSPFILANDGTADRFKLSNDGTIVINAPANSNNPLKIDVGGVERLKIDNKGTPTFTSTDLTPVRFTYNGAFNTYPAVAYNATGGATSFATEFRVNDVKKWGFLMFDSQTTEGTNFVFSNSNNNRAIELIGNTDICRIWGVLDVRINAASTLGPEIRVNNTKVLGPRITGWAAPSGTAIGTGLAGNKGVGVTMSTALTTAQLTSLLGQLIADLRTHGIIGT